MKHLNNRLLSAIIALFLLCCGTANAENVSLEKAKQAGAFFYAAATGAKAPVTSESLQLAQQFDNAALCIPALYCFNVDGGGYVVVSASDCVEPILAYSPDGRIDAESISPACRSFLEGYARVIADNQNLEATASAEVRKGWSELLDQTYSCDPTKGSVLVQSKWGQGDPDAPTYNLRCPLLSGKHCLAGCVPVAMGMIIRYWEYPTKGTGTAACAWNAQTVSFNFRPDSNAFDYSLMPSKITRNTTNEQTVAIAKLLFALGVSVKAQWGLDGTGSTDPNVLTAFPKYWKYASDLTYKNKSYNGVSDAVWIRTLHLEIDSNARPVYYTASASVGSGRDAAGHAFVICGSSATDQNKFYVNWGWDGGDNGFYTLAPANSIGMAGGYKFSQGHAMIYNLHPIQEVGISDLTSFSTSAAYPNPASDYIVIPAGNFANNALLSVYSIDGKMVDKAVIPAHSEEFRLNLQGYARGTYIYRLNGEAFKFSVR